MVYVCNILEPPLRLLLLLLLRLAPDDVDRYRVVLAVAAAPVRPSDSLNNGSR